MNLYLKYFLRKLTYEFHNMVLIVCDFSSTAKSWTKAKLKYTEMVSENMIQIWNNSDTYERLLESPESNFKW